MPWVNHPNVAVIGGGYAHRHAIHAPCALVVIVTGGEVPTGTGMTSNCSVPRSQTEA